MNLKNYRFVIWLADDSRDIVDLSNAVYEAGGDDMLFGSTDHVLCATVNRQATSLDEAIESACTTMQAAGLQVVRVELRMDDLRVAVA